MRSKVFRISRTRLAGVASSQYLRRMWPIFIAFPIFGALALIFGQNRLVQAIGLLAFIWPFTIPARIVLASWRKAKQLLKPTWVSLEGRVLYFHDEAGGGMKLPLDQVRRIDRRAGFYVFETRRFNFALVPLEAFEEPMRERFEKRLKIR